MSKRRGANKAAKLSLIRFRNLPAREQREERSLHHGQFPINNGGNNPFLTQLVGRRRKDELAARVQAALGSYDG